MIMPTITGMTKDQLKRVEIARDTLARLKAKKFYAKSQQYFDDATVEADQADEKVKDVCGTNVCAASAMFLVVAGNRKVKSVVEFDGDGYSADLADAVCDVLGEFFDQGQLREIIGQFDGGNWRGDIEDDDEALRLMMENIIVNKGTFDPNLRPALTTPGFKG